ncbi:hypothetical protein A8L34_22565 [Bacillus sp. FJAT-27264]|uniref:hypothetical protein n=1 Tax=Paenibacillus sp. (strain DSM 101736 / FJAT-27264) TaxID=1850362 RepID=UPI000807FBEC|nr:hypothetical protein [Bacillus sp. FJAT-27264]OBZ08935.1 hypothetical protein A8L34_22565 [Bacillus sp. FJAT-27264]
MAAFGGLTLTNKGIVLQSKAQAGAKLTYTRIAIGDGSLGGQSVVMLNALISQKKSLPITKIQVQLPNLAAVGAILSNQDITAGFHFREIGVFATDSDAGEILYAYANAGANAEYIPAGGGPDVVEKDITARVVVGTATNVSATINESLVLTAKTDFEAHQKAAVLDHPDKSVNTAKLADKGVTAAKMADGAATDVVIGNRSIVDTEAPTGDTGAPTKLWGWLAYTVKSITGETNWRAAPGMTIKAIKGILDAAVSAATANAIIKRDASGRAQVAAPSAAGDIARKDTVDAAITTAAGDATTKSNAVQTNLTTHVAVTSLGVHGSTSAATANTLMHRDAAGRSKAVAPIASDDIAIKSTVDAAISTAATDASTKAAAAQAAAISAAATDATTKANGAVAASVPLSQKGAAGGVVPLDNGIKIDEKYLPDSIVGQVEYKGTWNATTNIPTLPTATTAKGWYYVTSSAGMYSGIDFQVGDWVISDGTTWQKVDNTDAVPTVFGRTGNVVAAANDYTWAQINKAVSSLADIATRSAADLNSGTLPAARLPALTGDVTLAAGSNTTAIAPGVIVNADVSPAAGIDASKIGTGIVSNEEYGYLDGVTSAIQPQLNARPLLTTTPQQTTADITYYVRTDGNDNNNGLANTAAGAFKTIGKAISMIPQVINHTVVVNVAAGTYAENILIKGLAGSGTFGITASGTTNVPRILVQANTIQVTVTGFTATSAAANAIELTNNVWVWLQNCNATASAGSYYGVMIYGGTAVISGGTYSNKTTAIWARSGANVFVVGVGGSGSGYGYLATEGAKIGGNSGTMSATAIISSTQTGGIIALGDGVINPWGDNTWATRSFVRAYQGTAQTLLATTNTKVNFQVELSDNLAEYDPSLSRFVAKQSGLYAIKGSVGVGNMGANNRVVVTYNVDGGENNRLFDNIIVAGNVSSTASGVDITYLNAGQSVEIFVFSGIAMTLQSLSINTVFEIVRVA